MVSVLLEYIDLINIFNQALPIMLALCLMLLGTYYAQNYAGIIGASLTTGLKLFPFLDKILWFFKYLIPGDPIF